MIWIWGGFFWRPCSVVGWLALVVSLSILGSAGERETVSWNSRSLIVAGVGPRYCKRHLPYLKPSEITDL